MLTDKEQVVPTVPNPCPETETKERILAAALDVFGEKGYHQATMAEIAEAACVGKGTLYWHFSSKEDLFSGMTEQLIQKAHLKLRSVLATQQPFPELLQVFIKEFISFSDDRRQLTRLFISVPHGLSDELREKMLLWHLQFHEVNTELIRMGIKDGYFSPDLELEKVVTAFCGILFAFGGKQCLDEKWNQVEAEAVFIKELLSHGIGRKTEGDRDGEKDR